MKPILSGDRPKPMVFGHRGACAQYPENTLFSFEMAVQQGAIGIETDLQFTKDHHIVCFHDHLLNRLTKKEGSLHHYSLSELSKIHVIHKVYGSQPIPTLQEVLEWLPNEKYIILELKDPRFRDPNRMHALIDLLSSYNVIDKTIVASFSMANLNQAKKVLPSLPVCFITPINFSTTIPTDLLAPYYPILWLRPNYVEKAHQANKLVSVWDPHPEKRIQTYLHKQLDFLTGDNPRELIKAIQEAS